MISSRRDPNIQCAELVSALDIQIDALLIAELLRVHLTIFQKKCVLFASERAPTSLQHLLYPPAGATHGYHVFMKCLCLLSSEPIFVYAVFNLAIPGQHSGKRVNPYESALTKGHISLSARQPHLHLSAVLTEGTKVFSQEDLISCISMLY